MMIQSIIGLVTFYTTKKTISKKQSFKIITTTLVYIMINIKKKKSIFIDHLGINNLSEKCPSQ